MRTTHARWSALFVLAAAVVLAWARPAHADVDNCIPIGALPIEISAPGTYCLNHDLIQAINIAAAIEVKVDNVVLDCNGFTIRATNDSNTADGVYVSNGHSNVTVRNCVFDNFYVGIFVQSSTDPGAVGTKILDNTVLRSRTTAIWVIGTASRIERNKILGNTGNYSGGTKGITFYGGPGTVIRDNLIADFKPTPPASGNAIVGIDFCCVSGSVITGNTISGLYANTGWYVIGIRADSISNTTVANNTLQTPPPLAAPLDGSFGNGIFFSGLTSGQEASVICRENVVGHFGVNISGCTGVANTEY
jgi:nitrous oxidase accessory protein NosD